MQSLQQLLAQINAMSSVLALMLAGGFQPAPPTRLEGVAAMLQHYGRSLRAFYQQQQPLTGLLWDDSGRLLTC